MTTELTKAAQQAPKIKELVEQLRNIANGVRICGVDDRRFVAGRLDEIADALTQRPAAQTEREAFENAALAKWGPLDFERSEAVPEMYYNQRLDDAWIGFGFAVAWLRASLPTQHATQQATPEPVQLDVVRQAIEERDAMESRYHELAKSMTYKGNSVAWWHSKATAYRNAIDEVWSALKAAGIYADGAKTCADGVRELAATPEPVGEVFQFHPMPEGWPARFRCDSCDGNGEIGELVSMGHFQPPERQTCPDCGGRGWTSEEPAFNAEHVREFAEAHARNNRPAPGVPEGFALVPVEPTQEMVDAGNKARVYREHGSLDQPDVLSARTYNTKQAWSEMLAAAQAKS